MTNLCVIISGGYRTASTFIYISCLEIFKYNFSYFDWGIKLNIFLQKYSCDFPAVFKSHDFLPGKKEYKIIHTIRNPYDILSSLKKCNPALPDYMQEVKEIILRDKKFKENKNTLILKYEDFFGQEIKAINSILEFLNLDYPEKNQLAKRQNYKYIKKVTDKLKPGNPTPYTPRHISDNPEPGNYKKYLNITEISELKRFLGEQNIDKYWLD